MDHSVKYNFLMSQLTHIEDLKETEKTKISVVYHKGLKSSCILRICKNRDLSSVCMALRKIRNSNIVVVHDYIYENGDTYILEENVDGSTVAELLEDKGDISEQSTAKIIIEVCKALEELHREKPPVVHNDINPTNIKIREDGCVKLFDFDISRLYKKGQTQNTQLFGTEEYASPEHFGYGQSEPRTDIYCLGVTMHKMLTGRGLSNEHRITYNGRLKKVIKKCLAFDPQNRYVSVRALRKDLERFLSRKKRLFCGVLGVLVVAVIVVALVFVLGCFGRNNEEGTVSGNGVSTTEPKKEAMRPDANLDATRDNIVDTAVNTPTSQVQEPAPPKNDSRENAYEISLNQERCESLGEGENADWYKFTTSANNSIYRFYINTYINENPINGHTVMALYDNEGIQIEKISVEYLRDGLFDVLLSSQTEYTIKISAQNTGSANGDYLLFVSERICDAGTDKDGATELVLGSKYTAKLDSTFSDWYAFPVKETGEYKVAIHNIGVGCAIEFWGTSKNNVQFSKAAQNEETGIEVFRAEQGDTIYIEVKSRDIEANGTYIIVIEPE